MLKGGATKASILVWTLIFGAAFNILGWLGNNFLLGGLWDQASAQVKAGFAPPWPPLVKEAMTLLSDFVYAFAFVWMFANARSQTTVFALKLAFVVWLIGAALVYLVLVNSGFLPAEIAVKTSLLALVIFLASAPVLAAVFRKSAR